MYFKVYKSQKPKDKVWARVSKKVSKSAVVRNQVKRRMRVVLRQYKIDTDYIISALPGAEALDWNDFRRDLVDTLKIKCII